MIAYIVCITIIHKANQSINTISHVYSQVTPKQSQPVYFPVDLSSVIHFKVSVHSFSLFGRFYVSLCTA